MPDLILKGMTIKAGVRTKSMRRQQAGKRPTPQIKVIPRSSEAFRIVPLPDNTINSTAEGRTVDEISKTRQKKIDAGMLRFDI